jgi:exopolyphosphatase/guanosine-5'-triphosphate,3'-diphosphate pyrophosphatase
MLNNSWKMRLAVIDIGTNSTKLTVMDGAKILADEMVVTRIGEGVAKTGRIKPRAAERTVKCVKTFLRQARQLKAEKIFAVGTEALRKANNRDLFLKKTLSLGIKPQIISAEEESELSYLGATFGSAINNPLAMDIGGGSVEYVKRSARLDARSLPIGVVALTERFIRHDPPRDSEINRMRKFVSESIAFLKPDESPILAIGGTPAVLAFALNQDRHFTPEKYHQSRITSGELDVLQQVLFNITTSLRIKQYHIEKGRADLIVAGIVLLQETLSTMGSSEFIVSTRGLRHGVAYKYLMDKQLL